jgi:RND family efflux transporter MFP subunit
MPQPQSNRFATFITTAAVIFASGATFFALRPATAAQGVNARLPVISSKVTVAKGDLALTVTATGSVSAAQESSLSFQASGLITAVKVQAGQRVVKDQVLATVDASSQQLAVQQAALTVQSAQAALDKILAPVDPNQIAIAQANVKAAQGGLIAKESTVSSATIAAYQAKVQQAQSDDASAHALLNDAGGHLAQSDPNYQLALAQAGQADFNLKLAQLNLQEAQKGTPTGSASANIAYANAKLAQLLAGPTQSSIDQAQATLVAAQTQLAQAQHTLNNTILTAPYDGIITVVNANVGQVAAGTAMIIDDLSHLYVTVNVDEADISQIKSGQPVALIFDALPGQPVTGKVDRVNPVANAAASVITYPVRVVLDPLTTTNSAALPIRVGMTANATLTIKTVQQVLFLPNNYLKSNPTTGQITVSILNADGSSVRTVPVKIGVAGTDNTEIIQGVSEGDTAVIVAIGARGA